MKGKIFNAQEVQAIIAGTKTIFREVIKPQPIQLEGFSDVYFDCYSKGNPWNWYIKGNKQPLGTIAKCPYQVGQKIFVKESFARSFDNEGNPIAILETDGKEERKWRPAQHMKQEHSRLTLEITDVKVERLKDVSNADCRSEGEDQWSFICNWDATHKKPEEKFEANPFVWVVDFKINK